MARKRSVLVAFLIAAALGTAPLAQVQRPDYAAIGQIRDEGLNRSQVMDHLFWLADVYGPRLTGTPSLRKAGDWAIRRMTEWGLVNAHREEWEFGKGWTLVRFAAHLVEPQVQPLIGFPKAWTVGTTGRVAGDVTRATIQNEADFVKYRGQLKDKIVMLQPARTVRMLEGPIVLKMDDANTREAEATPVPGPPRTATRQDADFPQKLQQFLKDEGVVALFDRGSDGDMTAGGSDLSWQTQRVDGGTVFPGTADRRPGRVGIGVPQVTLAVEHYNRMVRLIERHVPVKAELELEVQFHDDKGFNIVGDIPGTDLADEIVMIGAHLDSVAASTGATDNAAGSAAMLEAMRILKSVGVRPRRTIRVALWGGEEEGLLGSRAFVLAHFGDPSTMQLKPEHAKLSVYFNLDNGTGRIRGIWMQSNLAVRPTFEQWIAPLRDLGVTILGPRSVAQTDHVAFDNIGLPGFQFIQERLEYNSRTHHSNMDVYDRLQRDDMIQIATVAAVFAYNAAMADERLPRKALPKPTGAGGTNNPQ